MKMERLPVLLPRIVMFVVMLAVIGYVMHFLLPGPAPAETGPDVVVLNPALQTGFLVVLTLFAALVGFWIIFGDLVNPREKG